MTWTIEGVWSTLLGGSVRPTHTGVFPGYPIELYAQLDVQGRPGLLALSDAKPAKPPTYSAFDIVIGRRADGRWAMSLSLAQEALKIQFSTMCEKVVTLGASCSAATDACSFLLQQVARWHRMLALGPDGLLTAEEQRGLLGELIVLEAAIERFGATSAVFGWLGPDEAPQDFMLPACAVEVKAIMSGGRRVKISSLLQLDIADGSLCLAVVALVHCQRGTGGTSLARLVHTVRGRLADDVAALDKFEVQLGTALYADRVEYDEVEFRIAWIRWFHVGEHFPKLARSDVPLPILEARYELLVSAISQFEINPFNDHGRT